MFIGHRSLRLLGGTPDEYISALINILDSPIFGGNFLYIFNFCNIN